MTPTGPRPALPRDRKRTHWPKTTTAMMSPPGCHWRSCLLNSARGVLPWKRTCSRTCGKALWKPKKWSSNFRNGLCLQICSLRYRLHTIPCQSSIWESTRRPQLVRCPWSRPLAASKKSVRSCPEWQQRHGQPCKRNGTNCSAAMANSTSRTRKTIRLRGSPRHPPWPWIQITQAVLIGRSRLLRLQPTAVWLCPMLPRLFSASKRSGWHVSKN
mmetsp:Transcript_20141/g.47617  ORF Transcript_20141/g.47617 Transcript_20141/m.47617 type:complete len:214 (-) Transcript_20141:3546-4187(-)